VTHPGLPLLWATIIWIFMLALALWALFSKANLNQAAKHVVLANLRPIRPLAKYMAEHQWPLQLLKIITVMFFLLVIYSGLEGTQIPQRNIATVLTWNLWWAGLIISVFFLGSAWCAICPWDTLASWIIRPKLWLKNKINNSLELTPPRWMRNVLPALLMFTGLTWLELGVGVTTSPYATALLSLLMVVLATLFLAIYRNRAFCHYICPVGRTIGFYAQLAPVELRPVDASKCAECTSLECFNGTATVDACPTQLVMGRLQQNTYCTSCGNCLQSCPEQNVFWRLRPQSTEAMYGARPHWDEAWFMLALLALTSFHGITMMEFWESWISQLARKIGDSGQLLMSFSVGLVISMLLPALIYMLSVYIFQRASGTREKFGRLFTGLVFISLPLAFSYHLAHNLNHMIRESVGASQLFYNPLGIDAKPVDASETILREYHMLISQDVLFVIQALLMMAGFWIAIRVLKHRAYKLVPDARWSLLSMIAFIMGVNGFNVWMLTQPMIMRVGALCVAPAG